MNLPKYAKGVIAFLVAAVAGAVAQGLIVGKAAALCTVVIGALTTAGVIAIPNTDHPGDDSGVVDPGSLALGLVIGLLLGLLLWHPWAP